MFRKARRLESETDLGLDERGAAAGGVEAADVALAERVEFLRPAIEGDCARVERGAAIITELMLTRETLKKTAMLRDVARALHHEMPDRLDRAR
ncbi:hypothetical protein BWQ93_02740 [Sphingopyxis sp. QXT-31]|uniref:hypothetical protein n=1 Tax=Sphingopyxis sp. QXT-31 TaxID=1357916 RepID=UPI0009794F5E|nr:hypothetical protein [Sphingopyxis sp. QXT-31]APZ97526.1 hypothetical protein BWQ93_02740 [Sphingopyxis sp. QXT-31]